MEPSLTEIEEETIVFLPDNSEWFEITSVETEKMENGEYLLNIEISSISSELPRLPKLVLENKLIGGFSSLNITDDGFDGGKFTFILNNETNIDEVLNTAKLYIGNEMVRVDTESASKVTNKTEIKTIKVVEK